MPKLGVRLQIGFLTAINDAEERWGLCQKLGAALIRGAATNAEFMVHHVDVCHFVTEECSHLAQPHVVASV